MAWIIGWYAFCVLNIMLMMWIFKVLNRPRYRGEDGDITTEVGYEEDSTGHVLPHPFEEGYEYDANQPHSMTGGNSRSGPI